MSQLISKEKHFQRGSGEKPITAKESLLVREGQEILEKARPHIVRRINDLRLLIRLRAEINNILFDPGTPALKDEKAVWVSFFGDEKDTEEHRETKNLYNALLDCRTYLEERIKSLQNLQKK